MNETFQRVTHAILRIGTGLLFIEHGFQKFGFLGGLSGPCQSCSWTAIGPTAAAIGLTRLQVAGWMELVGGALLIAGFLTRPVAAALLIEMLVAFYLAHFPRGGSPMQNIGEVPLLYACVFVFLAAHAAGPLSVDEARMSRPAARL
jgi:putative oxidoreductase